MAQKVFTGTREAWCIEVLQMVVDWLGEVHDLRMPEGRQIAISIASLTAKHLGYCKGSKSSIDGRTNHIVVCTKQADPKELAHTIVHEVLHSIDDCNSGHRGRWKKMADRVGLRARGHERSDEFDRFLDRVIQSVGIPGQHRPTLVAAPKSKNPSQVKHTCPACDGFARIPLAPTVEGYRVACMTCRVEMVPEPIEV